ncbi:MAG: DUF1836 domain-containing protein [Lachnospiraceae bacterium]|nr:DUF1836 domain-containing protein [Lachnospiraceae bacterium]
MNFDTRELIRSMLNKLSQMDYIRPESIPDIELYMDQITTFMDTQLASSKRHPEDKILTKTMINNYAKNNLLPPPVKKKYSKEHVLMLIFIYYFKNILSIGDIEAILNPLAKRFFHTEDEPDLTAVYQEVFSLEKDEVKNLMKDITKKYKTSIGTFPDAPKEDEDFLHTFSFICMLSFDVFVKQMLLQRIIDEIRESEQTDDSENAKASQQNAPKDSFDN